MASLLVPPTRNEWTFSDGVLRHPSDKRFWAHFGAQPRGRTLIKTDGTWTEIPTPTREQINAADLITDPLGFKVPGVFLGGHVATVTDAVAAELITDGFEDYLTGV